MPLKIAPAPSNNGSTLILVFIQQSRCVCRHGTLLELLLPKPCHTGQEHTLQTLSSLVSSFQNRRRRYNNSWEDLKRYDPLHKVEARANSYSTFISMTQLRFGYCTFAIKRTGNKLIN